MSKELSRIATYLMHVKPLLSRPEVTATTHELVNAHAKTSRGM